MLPKIAKALRSTSDANVFHKRESKFLININLRGFVIWVGDDNTKWFIDKNAVESMIFDNNTMLVHGDKSSEMIFIMSIA